MRSHLLRSLIVLCLSSLAGAALAQGAPDVQRVLIGVTSPFSGLRGIGGNDALNGARLAVDRLNQQGMQIGDKPVRFEVLAKDDQGNPERGLQVAQEFVQARVSAVVGPLTSAVALAVTKTYNQNRLPMLTVATNPAVTRTDYDYIFRLSASDAELGRKMVQYAARTLKIKRVAVIQDGSGYAEGLASELQSASQKEGVQLTVQLQLSETASDPEVRSVLQQVRNSKPDAVFFAGYPPQAARLLREMHTTRLAVPVLAGDAQCSVEMLRLVGDFLDNGVYCVQGGVWLTRVADGAVFAASYQSRYGQPPDVYAGSFYDGVMLLAQAMKTAGSTQPEQFLPALTRSRYKGVISSYEFNAKHDLKDSTATILRLKDGALVPMASF